MGRERVKSVTVKDGDRVRLGDRRATEFACEQLAERIIADMAGFRPAENPDDRAEFILIYDIRKPDVRTQRASEGSSEDSGAEE